MKPLESSCQELNLQRSRFKRSITDYSLVSWQLVGLPLYNGYLL